MRRLVRGMGLTLAALWFVALAAAPVAKADELPPPFVPGYPGVQPIPGGSSLGRTFCGPFGWETRFFETGLPGEKSYSRSVMWTGPLPLEHPLKCP